jgi:hypothetical protein
MSAMCEHRGVNSSLLSSECFNGECFCQMYHSTSIQSSELTTSFRLDVCVRDRITAGGWVRVRIEFEV